MQLLLAALKRRQQRRKTQEAIASLANAKEIKCEEQLFLVEKRYFHFVPDWLCSELNTALHRGSPKGGDTWLMSPLAEVGCFEL